MKKIIIAIIFCFAVFALRGQTLTCAETLTQAERMVEQGNCYGIAKMLKPCLDNGFNTQQRMDAYFLLTQTYLFIDDPIAAEDSYLKLLHEDPEFIPNQELDPIDVIYLSEKFTTRPIFIFTSRVGANYTATDVILPFNTSDLPLQADYTLGYGFEAGLGLDVVFSDFLSIGTEINLVQKKYKFNQVMFGNDQQSMVENQWNVEIPLFARLSWNFGKLTPYVYGGPSVSYLFSATADLELIDYQGQTGPIDEEGSAQQVPVNGPAVDIMDQRVGLNYNVIAGAGVRFKLNYNYLSIDLRYRGGLNNIVDEVGHYQNNELLYRYGYVDDYKRLNNLVLSVGFVKPFYKPRKRKKFRK
jgi:opacity protein-like surface antigen